MGELQVVEIGGVVAGVVVRGIILGADHGLTAVVPTDSAIRVPVGEGANGDHRCGAWAGVLRIVGVPSAIAIGHGIADSDTVAHIVSGVVDVVAGRMLA